MTRPVLDGTRPGSDPAGVPERRRHRLIWSAVGCVHLAAVAAVWVGGAAGLGEPTREGGLILVTLVTEPIALPGEAKGGVALGAGLPVPVAVSKASGEAYSSARAGLPSIRKDRTPAKSHGSAIVSPEIIKVAVAVISRVSSSRFIWASARAMNSAAFVSTPERPALFSQSATAVLRLA